MFTLVLNITCGSVCRRLIGFRKAKGCYAMKGQRVFARLGPRILKGERGMGTRQELRPVAKGGGVDPVKAGMCLEYVVIEGVF